MGSFTNYAELKILDHATGRAAWTVPTNTWIGLFTATPSDTGGGTEVAGNGYARQQATWAAAAAGAIATSAQLEFTAAGGDWGSITHWAIFDAVSAGNMIAWGAWDVARTINNGDTARIIIGAASITLD